MHPLLFLAQTVENGADGVGNAAGQQQTKTARFHYGQHLPPEGDDGPAHADVTDHGEHSGFLQVDGGEGGGGQRQSGGLHALILGAKDGAFVVEAVERRAKLKNISCDTAGLYVPLQSCGTGAACQGSSR